MTEPILLVACVLLVGAVAALVVALVRLRAGTARELAVLREEVAGVSVSLRGLDTGSPGGSPGSTNEGGSPGSANEDGSSSASEPEEYLITRLGTPDEEPDARATTIDGRLFADLVLRETVVKAGALAHGVRRGLAAETRNRIRFEMRREVRRARKQRRADLKQAEREWKARQRASLAEEDAA